MSIVTRIRFTEGFLSYGIEAFQRKGIDLPRSTNEVIRAIYEVGLINILGENFQYYSPSISAQEHLESITKQTKKSHNPASKLISFNNIKKIKNELKNAHLLQYLSPEEQRKGNNILHYLSLSGENITKNLKDPNKKIASLTYKMFKHARNLSLEEIEAIREYENKNNII